MRPESLDKNQGCRQFLMWGNGGGGGGGGLVHEVGSVRLLEIQLPAQTRMRDFPPYKCMEPGLELKYRCERAGLCAQAVFLRGVISCESDVMVWARTYTS